MTKHILISALLFCTTAHTFSMLTTAQKVKLHSIPSLRLMSTKSNKQSNANLITQDSKTVVRQYINGDYVGGDLIKAGPFSIVKQSSGSSINVSLFSLLTAPIRILWRWAFNNNTQGSGKAATQQLSIENIKNISASGIGNLFIQQCDNSQNCSEVLTVTADDNILPYLKQDISGDKLTIRIENNVSFYLKTPIRYHAIIKKIHQISNSGSIDIESPSISTDDLTITTSGSGDITIKDIIAKQLSINISGSGDVEAHINTNNIAVHQTGSGDTTLSGITNTQTIKSSGSGDYNARRLKSKVCSIKNSGSGDNSLTVEEKITGSNTGSGDIFYNSKYIPHIDVKKTGSGKVKKASL
jgi:hypothetical protein